MSPEKAESDINMAGKDLKTNVMRLLEQKNISYTPFFYEEDPTLTGVEIANILGEDIDCVFKTLVTVGASKEHYVFVVPVEAELDLKKAAKAVSEKNIEMIKQKELLSLTGYVHGGCSPIGMKKQFKTVVDETVILLDEIYFSAGKVGAQVRISTSGLEKAFEHTVFDITK